MVLQHKGFRRTRLWIKARWLTHLGKKHTHRHKKTNIWRERAIDVLVPHHSGQILQKEFLLGAINDWLFFATFCSCAEMAASWIEWKYNFPWWRLNGQTLVCFSSSLPEGLPKESSPSPSSSSQQFVASSGFSFSYLQDALWKQPLIALLLHALFENQFNCYFKTVHLAWEPRGPQQSHPCDD